MAKPSPFPGHSKLPKAYEKSKFDNDKGVKEGSKADLKRDKKGFPAFLKSKGRGK